ncbi:MAG: hypothetical protein U0169_06680 [Polyangiaceae bacterium]
MRFLRVLGGLAFGAWAVTVVACSSTGEGDENVSSSSGAAISTDGNGFGLRLLEPERVAFATDDKACPDHPTFPGQERAFWVPDSPMNALVDGTGALRLFAGHHLTFPFQGIAPNALASTLKLGIDCATKSMTSRYDANPDKFDDALWIWAPKRLQNGRFVSLVHGEYHGGAHGPNNPACPSGDYGKCWYNTVLLAKSTDGLHYALPGSARDSVVASSHIPYVPDGGNVGYFEPSNIVFNKTDKAYYALVRAWGQATPANTAAAQRPQANGLCILRAVDPENPGSWTVRDNGAWVRAAGAHCDPVIAGGVALGSLAWSTFYDAWVTITFSDDGTRQGFYMSVSNDLVRWSPLKRVIDVDLPWGANASKTGLSTHAYPSLIDPNGGPFFDEIGREPYLYWVRFHVGNMQREVMRAKVRFEDGPVHNFVNGQGCYRVGPAGFYSNGDGSRCALLDVDLPNICGLPATGFASLPEKEHGLLAPQTGFGGRCAGGAAVGFTGTQPAGCYRVGGGAYYANGQGSFCNVNPEDLAMNACGTTNFSALTEHLDHGTDRMQSPYAGCFGWSTEWIQGRQPAGCYREVSGGNFFANGQGQCCRVPDSKIGSICGGNVGGKKRFGHGTDALQGDCQG